MSETNDPEAPFSKRDIHEGEIETHLQRIHREFKDGFEFLRKYPHSVSVMGSSLVARTSPDYLKAEELGGRIVRELKYAVTTGGGPGIMEAANKGAYEADGMSLGLNISLPHEHVTNAYVRHSMKFSYFFSRKTMLTFVAEAYVFFPGGYGTFDELFSILTLIQTDKIPHVPVIMYDSTFWKPLTSFIQKEMYEKRGLIDKRDLPLFEVTDSLDQIIEIIRKAPVSDCGVTSTEVNANVSASNYDPYRHANAANYERKRSGFLMLTTHSMRIFAAFA